MSANLENGRDYAFMNWDCKTVIDLANGNPADGTVVLSYGAYLPGDPNQVWTLLDKGNGWFALKNRKSGTFLTLSDGGNGKTIVGQNGNEDEGDRQWRPTAKNRGDYTTTSFKFENREYGKFIDNADGSVGKTMVGWDDNGSDRQQFIAIPIGWE